MNRLSVTTDRGSQWKYSLLVLMVSNNKPNIINLTRDNDTELHVDFTKEMLPVNGRYIMQFEYTDGNVVGHTDKFDAFVNDVINTEDTWVDVPSEFEQLRQEIMQNAIIAQNAANEAKKISQEIKVESDKAVQAAKDAQQYAQQAQQAVDLTQEAQRLAQEANQAAQEAKNQAVLSATEAEQSAIQANQSKTEAAESATQANQAKVEAKESATQASQSATQANLSKDEAKKAQLASEKARDESQAILEQVQNIKVEVDGIVAQINDARDKALQAIETNKNSAVESVNNTGTNNVANVNQAGAAQVKAVNDAGVKQVQAVTNEGNKQVGLVTGEGTKQLQAVAAEGTKQVQAVTTEGTNQLQSIRNEGSKQVQSITTEGTAQVKKVSDEGAKQVQAVTAQGKTQTNLVVAEGTKQVGLVNTAGQEQVKAVNDAGTIQTANAKEQADRAKTEADRAEKAADGVQDIASSIDRLAIHETAAGNPAAIRDSADWQMEGLRVYGQSEQVTTTGAQMFDASKRIVGGVINNGIQGSNSRYACSDFIEIPQGTRNLYQSGGALNQRGFYDADKAFISKPGAVNNVTAPDNAKYIRISSDIDKTDMGNIMLCAGNTAKPFEPYTGGKPAPSPEYPQEIVSREVSEIVVTGKNLLDSSAFNGFSDKGITVIRMPDGGLHYAGTMESDNVDGYLLRNVKLGPGDYVFFSHNIIIPQISFIRNGRRVWVTGKFTLRGDETDIYIYLIVRGSTGQKIDFIAHPQLELGSVATLYEPYHAQTVTLSAPVTLRGVPVTTGGNVTINGRQYMADRITEHEGVVGVERNVITANLAVSEMNNTETHPGWKRKDIVDKLKNPQLNSICNVFGERSISFNFPAGIIFLAKRDLQQSEWREKYPDLVFDIWMILAKPSFEPLPEADQQAIRALRTYHGNTVVTAGAHTEVDYIADPKLYIDNKIAEISAAIVAR